MKILNIAAGAVIVLMLAAACQKTPTEPNTPMETDEATSGESVATSETQGAAVEEISPIVSFYEPAGTGEEAPTYLLFIKPWEKDYPAQVTTTCKGVEAYVVAGTNGIVMNNHCILETGDATAYAILSDGSTIFIGPETRLQINLGEGMSEVILEAGEIVNNVAPQGSDRSYSVLAGDAVLEVEGTQFGVSLKGKQIHVGVVDGRVKARRCTARTTRACTSWRPNTPIVEAGQRLTGAVSGADWGTPEAADFYNGNVEDFPLLSAELLNGIPIFGVSINGEHFDEINHADAVSSVVMRIEWKIIEIGNDVNAYNQLIGEQYKLMDYCITYSGNCPVAEVIATATAEPQQPATGGGGGSGPSGKFPAMDQGSCFTNGGAMFCYPVAGSVDVSLSGEWNITAICASYPGETFCAWLP